MFDYSKMLFGHREKLFVPKDKWPDSEFIVFASNVGENLDVLRYKEYPKGPPVIIEKNFDYTLKSYFGFVCCQVIPPPSINLPILPSKLNGEVYYFVCVWCHIENNDNNCVHATRKLAGVWTTFELNLAAEYGYQIKSILKVIHYPERQRGLYTAKINCLLKIKIQSSGWHYSCKTNADKEAFIEHYRKRDGIILSRAALDNPDFKLRSKVIAKLQKLWDDACLIDTNDYTRSGLNSAELVSFITSYSRIILYRSMSSILKGGNDCLLKVNRDMIAYVNNSHAMSSITLL